MTLYKPKKTYILTYEELGFCNQLHFVLDASNQYQQTLSTKGIGNNSSNSDMRKQRVAMKKDLQRKLDHWDKDTDKSRYSISTDTFTSFTKSNKF